MSTPPTSDIAAFDQIRRQCERLRQQVRKVIIGQDEIVEQLLTALFCQGHVLIVGVPGLAKTLLVRTLAQALDLHFRRIQFTPDMMPSDILGAEIIQEDPRSGERSLRFVPGPVFAQLVLADEINRCPPKTQSALLEAMAERQVTVAGRTLPLDKPFVVIATQNPIEQEGTYPLPEAQLDRFLFSLWMDYPRQEEETRIVLETPRIMAQKIECVFQQEELARCVDLVRQMPVSRHVADYAVRLARATRPGAAAAPEITQRYVEWGAGPRAGQCLVHSAQARAALEGAPTPNCQHVRRAALAVLRHRVIVNYTATGEGVNSAQVIERILDEVSEPRYE